MEVSGDKVLLVDAAGNRVNVIKTDIAASDGWVHVNDAILIPSQEVIHIRSVRPRPRCNECRGRWLDKPPGTGWMIKNLSAGRRLVGFEGKSVSSWCGALRFIVEEQPHVSLGRQLDLVLVAHYFRGLRQAAGQHYGVRPVGLAR